MELEKNKKNRKLIESVYQPKNAKIDWLTDIKSMTIHLGLFYV